ncbi:MAG: hypothetical protein JOZ38_04575 [Candidatus Eremiobacteraeota bacterium]|nr:hypothetical protein [Candidatus Eremiobacteraeota bacterium]
MRAVLERSDLSRLMQLQGDLRIDWIESPALENNPLGDPHVRPVAVYLPPEYDPQSSQRYPVLYCLHGYTGSVAALVSSRAWETNVVQWIDRLTVDRRIPPAILAIVDGFTRLGGSQYVDSAHNGDYATYVVRDVIGHIDRSYRTLAVEGSRAVFGKSSGGFGSLHLTMRHPGVFSAFASHSGDSYFRYAYVPSFAAAQRTLVKFEWNVEAFVSHFERQHKRAPHEFSTMEMLGYTAAYSPRGPLRFDLDLPFERATGELNEEVFDRWLSFDPVEVCGRYRKELERLRLRYLDCGRKDEYALDVGARLLASRLRGMGMDVHHEEFDDDHRNVGYRYGVSLPLLVHALDY